MSNSKTPKTLTIGEWSSIGLMFQSVNETAKAIATHTIEPKEAVGLCALYRCGINLIGLMLSHAKTTGRLKENQASLPGFSLPQK